MNSNIFGILSYKNGLKPLIFQGSIKRSDPKNVVNKMDQLIRKVDDLAKIDQHKTNEIRNLCLTLDRYKKQVSDLHLKLEVKSLELDMCVNILAQLKSSLPASETIEKIFAKFHIVEVSNIDLPYIQ